MNTPQQTQTVTVEAEVINNHKIMKPTKLMAEDGKVHTEMLTPEIVAKCKEITRNLNPKDLNCVTNYGVEISKRLSSTNSKSNLLNRKSTNNETTDAIIRTLMEDMQKIRLEDLNNQNALVRFLSQIPVINKLIPSLDKKIQSYKTLQEKVNGIEGVINDAQVKAYEDNSELQHTSDEIENYILQLENLIIAGQVKLNEERENLQKMVDADESSLDIRRQQSFINRMEKKIEDLYSIRAISKIQLNEIFITQDTNLAVIDSASTLLNLTLNAFGMQLKILAAMANQKEAITTLNIVRDANGKMIRSAADQLKENVTSMAEFANKSAVDSSDVEYSVKQLKEAMQAAYQIEEKYRNERGQRIAHYCEIEKEIKTMEQMRIASGEPKDSAVMGISLTEK